MAIIPKGFQSTKLTMTKKELNEGIRDAVDIFKKEFPKSRISISETQDPDSGNVQKVIEVSSPTYCLDERIHFRFVIRELLPETTMNVRDQIVFDLTRLSLEEPNLKHLI